MIEDDEVLSDYDILEEIEEHVRTSVASGPCDYVQEMSDAVFATNLNDLFDSNGVLSSKAILEILEKTFFVIAATPFP